MTETRRQYQVTVPVVLRVKVRCFAERLGYSFPDAVRLLITHGLALGTDLKNTEAEFAELTAARSELEKANAQLAHALGQVKELREAVAKYESREKEYFVAFNRRLAALQSDSRRAA